MTFVRYRTKEWWVIEASAGRHNFRLMSRPADPGGNNPAAVHHGLVHRGGRPIRCLVVEDEPLIALEFQDIIEARGAMVVAFATGGARAIALAEQYRPDIVLMDISIRGDMDGIEAARTIMARFAIPVVFISALGDAMTRARIAALDGPELLAKPVSDDHIVAAIRRACRLDPPP
jgi:two-component system, response regulator PdtaR